MANFIRPKAWTQKPPPGTPLNQSHPLAQSAAGIYLFNEGGGGTFNDSSGVVNNTQITNNGLTWQQGLFGSALSFAGDVSKYVKIANFPKTSSERVLISAWVYCTALTGSFQVIAANWGDTNTEGEFFFCLNSSNQLAIYAQVVGGVTPNVAEGVSFPTNSWQHVAASVDSNMLRLFRNGQLVASVSNSNAAVVTTTAWMSIGMRLSDSGGLGSTPLPWNGLIDNLMIFNETDHDNVQAVVESLYLNPFSMFMPQRRLIGVGGTGVIYDSTSNSGYQASVSTYNWTSHSVTTQTNRMMLLEIAVFASGSVSSATLGSQNFTFLRAKTNGVYRIETWYLIAPNTGTNTVTVNLSASVTSIATELVYYNTDQTAPIDVQGDNSGTGNPATVALTSSKTNSRMVGSLVTPTASGVTDAAGQNQRDIQSGALGTQVVSDSDNIASPASNTLTWNNIGTLDTWASTGVMLITPQANISSYISFLSLLGVG